MDTALQEIYDQIPLMDGCDRRCWTSCTSPIDMTDRERQRIRQAGFRITPVEAAARASEPYRCAALTAGRLCAVYDLRPVICRLWGAMQSLPCVYGCQPAGRSLLTDEQGFRLLCRAAEIAGHAFIGPGKTTEEVFQSFLRLMRGRMGRHYLSRSAELDRQAAQDAIPAAFRHRTVRDG